VGGDGAVGTRSGFKSERELAPKGREWTEKKLERGRNLDEGALEIFLFGAFFNHILVNVGERFILLVVYSLRRPTFSPMFYISIIYSSFKRI
jgi:hypothetical protein